MAQQSTVLGIFGLSPELYQQREQDLREAEQLAVGKMSSGPGSLLSPSMSNIYAQATQQGQMIGQGARAIGGLMGIEDPQLQMIREVTELRKNFDVTTPRGLQDFAAVLAPKYPELAIQAATKAAELEETMAKTGKSRADAFTAQNKLMNEIQLRQELANLGPNATQDQIIAVVSKYGSPDAVLRTLQSSQDRQAQLDLRRGVLEEKKAEKEAKLTQQQEMTIGAVDRVINEVKEAKPMVGRLTAGFGGSALGSIPGTEARDLQAKLTTIKANLGFDRLQQMRDASPTGGALGQVAVQELVALQSTVASLDQAQSPKQLKDALDKIERHYTKWRETVRKAGGQDVQQAPEQQQPVTQGSTKVVDYSTLPKRK